MMTILDEHKDQDKYQHLLLVEYYEYVARLAFRHHDLAVEYGITQARPRQSNNYRSVAEFLDKLLDRQVELGNLKKKEADPSKDW